MTDVSGDVRDSRRLEQLATRSVCPRPAPTFRRMSSVQRSGVIFSRLLTLWIAYVGQTHCVSSCLMAWLAAYANVNDGSVRKHNSVHLGDKSSMLIFLKPKLWDLTKTLLHVGDKTPVNVYCFFY